MIHTLEIIWVILFVTIWWLLLFHTRTTIRVLAILYLLLKEKFRA